MFPFPEPLRSPPICFENASRIDFNGAPSKDFKCVLSGYDGEKITLTGDFGEISLPAADISAMNYDDFDDHELIEDGE